MSADLTAKILAEEIARDLTADFGRGGHRSIAAALVQVAVDAKTDGEALTVGAIQDAIEDALDDLEPVGVSRLRNALDHAASIAAALRA
jgi:hypothetical protein